MDQQPFLARGRWWGERNGGERSFSSSPASLRRSVSRSHPPLPTNPFSWRMGVAELKPIAMGLKGTLKGGFEIEKGVNFCNRTHLCRGIAGLENAQPGAWRIDPQIKCTVPRRNSFTGPLAPFAPLPLDPCAPKSNRK